MKENKSFYLPAIKMPSVEVYLEVVNFVMGGNESKLSEMGPNYQKWVKNGSEMDLYYQKWDHWQITRNGSIFGVSLIVLSK